MKNREKIVTRGIGVLLIFLSLNALAGGGLMILDPTGHLIQISSELLEDTPFNDYLFPGIILFVLIGLSSLTASVLTLKGNKNHHVWALIVGILLAGWLIIELLINPKFFHAPLHYPLFSLAIVLVIFGVKRINKIRES